MMFNDGGGREEAGLGFNVHAPRADAAWVCLRERASEREKRCLGRLEPQLFSSAVWKSLARFIHFCLRRLLVVTPPPGGSIYAF